MKPITCPNCQSVWGFDEIQFQSCDCCGYPAHEDEDDYYDEDEPDYTDFDCTCGAWVWSDKQCKPVHVADCICGSNEPW